MAMYNPLIKEYRGRFGKGRTMDDIVDLVDELPPMPDVIAHALRLVDDPSATPEELANVIMLDPALASPILRTANSASLGHQREVTTPELLTYESSKVSAFYLKTPREWSSAGAVWNLEKRFLFG
jgi:hypothetical protein